MVIVHLLLEILIHHFFILNLNLLHGSIDLISTYLDQIVLLLPSEETTMLKHFLLLSYFDPYRYQLVDLYMP
jgi:hypothetical protein